MVIYPYVTMLQRANCDNIGRHVQRVICQFNIKFD